ncbi:MAG: response regulator [Polyangiaceae bacterium]|nr:response regulator [Polyangiaceae bacterium]
MRYTSTGGNRQELAEIGRNRVGSRTKSALSKGSLRGGGRAIRLKFGPIVRGVLAAYTMQEDRSISAEPERAAQTEFIQGFSRRLAGLREALTVLRQRPDDRAARDQLQRRLHAVATATQVLGLASAAEALLDAVRLLENASRGGVTPEQVQTLNRVLEIVPELLHERPVPSTEDWQGASPVHVLVFGAPFIVEGLGNGRRQIECFLTDDFTEALEHLRTHGPNVAVVDSGARQARQLIRAITTDSTTEPIPVLVLTPPGEGSAQHWIQAGASAVLKLPLSPEDFRRTLFSFGSKEASGLSKEGLGQLDLASLSRKIAEEIQSALVTDALTEGDDVAIDFGKGSEVIAAVWGAVAKVRQVVAVASAGQVRFKDSGPVGSVVLDGLASTSRGTLARDAGNLAQVELKGRKAVVADDDPAIVWLLSDVLKSVGMQVFEAKDGEQALELVRDHWPDLVITDVVMPRLDGLELCRQLKRDIAVRDVPVILLSWKEDLLQRVRELGVSADGYIRKETDAGTLMERVREVLRPRARVEARLLARAPVSGRLDGLTPRWLLEGARRFTGDARIQLHDAAYVYEVELREGEPVTATRTNGEGSVERGKKVLRAFLGVSAGRFELKPESTSVTRELYGTLEEQILPLIDQAREISRTLSASALLNIESVELDAKMASGYLGSTPLSARLLTQRLLSGASPRDLILSGEFAPSAVHSVLWDLNLHGAIEEVHSLDLALCGPEVVAPSGFSFQLSPEPAKVMPVNGALLTGLDLTPSDLGNAVLSLAADTSPWPAKATPKIVLAPARQAEAVVNQPQPGVEHSLASTEQPQAPTEQPQAISQLPPITTEQPQASVEPPDTSADSILPIPPTPVVVRHPARRPEAEDESPVEAVIASEALGFGGTPEAPSVGSAWPDDSEEASPAAPPVAGDGANAPPASIRTRLVGWSKALVPPAAAAVVAFGLVRYVVVPSLAPSATADTQVAGQTQPAAQAPAQPGIEGNVASPPNAVASSLQVAASAPKPPQIETLPAPEGIPVPTGLGLLLLETGARHSFYLDGDFIGVGPRRYAQLPPGKHEVRLSLPGAEQTFSVSIEPGKMTRVRPADGLPATP